MVFIDNLGLSKTSKPRAIKEMIDTFEQSLDKIDLCIYHKQSQVTTNKCGEYLCKYMCNMNIDFIITYYNRKS